jgi:LmbE family N-acetylglucosaminyl deacetylase
MLEYLKNKKIMVVVAHPDDEILGIGGTINLLAKLGAKIKVVILGEGITSRSNERNINKDEKKLLIHKNNIKDAKELLGYQELSTHNIPDNRFDTFALLDLIKIIEHEKYIYNPEVIFTHHGGDLNIDHQKTFEAVLTSVRPVKKETVKALICFETMSSTEWSSITDSRNFIPNFFIVLTEDELIKKTAAMNSYIYEKRDFPHPRSEKGIRNRAQMWGITIGAEFAEPFQIIRIVE